MADVGDSPPEDVCLCIQARLVHFYNNLAKKGCVSKKNGLREEETLKLQLQIGSPSFVQLLSHFTQFRVLLIIIGRKCIHHCFD